MEFHKYSGKDGTTIGVFNPSSPTASATTQTTGGAGSSSSSDSERWLWGNEDTGDDITETIHVGGSIYVGVPADDDENGTDDDKTSDPASRNFPVRSGDNGGNVYVDNCVWADATEADQTYGKQLFLNYPDVNGAKTDVAPLLKQHADSLADHETRITTNTTNISSLTTRVSANETSITNLTTRVTANETSITDLTERISFAETRINNNAININSLTTRVTVLENAGSGGGDEVDLTPINNTLADHESRITTLENAGSGSGGDSSAAITALQTQVASLESLIKYGTQSYPVCIFAGYLMRRNGSATDYVAQGSGRLECFSINVSLNGGIAKLHISPNTGYGVNVWGVTANMRSSMEMPDDEVNTSYTGRYGGAHWLQCWVDTSVGTGCVYIRNFSTANDDNDSWNSSSWESTSDGISGAEIIMMGNITKTEF